MKKQNYVSIINRLLLTVSATTISLLTLGTNVAHAGVNDFYFQDFHADYSLIRTDDKYSKMDVTETMTAVFPSSDQNHGIERALPTALNGYDMRLKIYSVTDAAGKKLKYTTRDDNGVQIVRIGDANVYVHGPTTYKISYSYNDIINKKAVDELYWNINGNMWNQAFDSVSASVNIPAELSASITPEQKCYSGATGSTASNCTITRTTNSDGGVTIDIDSGGKVNANENISYVIGFTSDTFQIDPAAPLEEKPINLSKKTIGVILAVVTGYFVASAALVYAMYKKVRGIRDEAPEIKTIVPYYSATDVVDPLLALNLLDPNNRISPKAYSAYIVQLAVLGYLSIIEKENNGLFGKKTTTYLVRLTNIPNGLDEAYQVDFLRALFGNDLLLDTEVDLKKLSANKQKKLLDIQKSVKQTSLNNDYTKSPEGLDRAKTLTIVLLGVSFVLFNPVMMISLILLLTYIYLKPKTVKGADMVAKLKGIKMYIKLAEADRLKFGQSVQGAERISSQSETPESMIKLYEKLLPYAILFGLEKSWTEQFGSVLSENPVWYQGNINAFTAGSFVSSISSFSAGSSSSIGSGFSGGSSGGGGGGGGGGGW
jgi:uncharacterized membrane protein YgcG